MFTKTIQSAAVAIGLSFSGFSFANEINTLECVADAPCFEQLATAETMLELGEQRPFEMYFSDGESRIGITFSEMLGLGTAALETSRFRPQPSSDGTYGFRPLEDYRTVEMYIINTSLNIVVYKPYTNEEILIRRDAENEADTVRVQMSFDSFINAVQVGYHKAIGQEMTQRLLGKNSSITDTIVRAQLRSVLVSTEGDNIDFTAEYFREENLQYTAYRAYADRPGENKRDPSHNETIIVDGTGGYTHSSLSIGGNTVEHTIKQVRPQVASIREEYGAYLNGVTTVGRGLTIEIDGEDTIDRTGRDEDYNDWRFSNLGLQLFGSLPDHAPGELSPGEYFGVEGEDIFDWFDYVGGATGSPAIDMFRQLFNRN